MPKLLRIAALLLVDSIFFGAINPRDTLAIVIVVGFALLVVTIYTIVDLLLVVAERVVRFKERTRHRILLSVTAVTGMLIAMQSIGQLTPRDVLAIVPLVLVGAFYVSYQKRDTK